jgi:hypothetical protein
MKQEKKDGGYRKKLRSSTQKAIQENSLPGATKIVLSEL